MALRWYMGYLPIVVQQNRPAIRYGESYDFPDEQAAALDSNWSSEDPFATKRSSNVKKHVAEQITPNTEPDIGPEKDKEE